MAANDSTYSPSDIQRFWSKVDKSGGEDACWLWTSACNADGYGKFQAQGKTNRANRVAWEIAHGAIPPKLLICHRCDNPQCVNPRHLFLGTEKDNYDDSRLKGRNTRGERIGVSKLTQAAVVEIRKRHAQGGITQTQLALEYGVCRAAISHVLSGRNWKGEQPS